MAKASSATGIKSWPVDDRPREKLLKKGAKALSNSELLAILLRTGTNGSSAIDLARRVMKKFGTFRNMAHTDTRTGLTDHFEFYNKKRYHQSLDNKTPWQVYCQGSIEGFKGLPSITEVIYLN